MEDGKQPLRCPKCKSEGEFKIAAIVWVHVTGDDALDVLDEDGDREYGSDDACRCETCGHQAALGEFYKEGQE